METVKIKSDAHPSGYMIVNADDPRAKKPAEKPKGSVKPRAKDKRSG